MTNSIGSTISRNPSTMMSTSSDCARGCPRRKDMPFSRGGCRRISAPRALVFFSAPSARAPPRAAAHRFAAQ
eukprot:5549033-Pyramimonas_sp.AAC.1